MAEIQAFRGYRYDLGRVGAFSDVIAPPYDVIDAELQARLYDKNPHNVIRLELNRETPADNDNDNRYTRSAKLMKEWIADGSIKQDSARSLYVYHQEFEAEGQKFVRKGFMARVKLEPFGQGKIFPHEETFSGPKEDRFKLMRATGMNISQVFGLYPDDNGDVQECLEKVVGRTPPLEAADHLGVINRLWPVADQHAISQVMGLMGPKPIFIADGHHRYETGLRYLNEAKQAGKAPDAEAPANFILMMLVRMNDPGLIVLPTHRLLSGIPQLTTEQLRTLLGEDFQLETTGKGTQAAHELWKRIEADGGQDLLGLGTVADGAWHLARFKSAGKMASWSPNHSETWHGLGVAILHVGLVDHILVPKLNVTPSCKYVHLVKEVTDVVDRRECQLAVLVPAATMTHVEQIAGHLEKMPQKSTYFYPKLDTGLVFNSVTGH